MTTNTDYAALVERFRGYLRQEYVDDASVMRPDPDLQEAADAIESLLARATATENWQFYEYEVARAYKAEAALLAKEQECDALRKDEEKRDGAGHTFREYAALKKDAARYQWLRAHSFKYRESAIIEYGQGFNQTSPEILDAAIDAALDAFPDQPKGDA